MIGRVGPTLLLGAALALLSPAFAAGSFPGRNGVIAYEAEAGVGRYVTAQSVGIWAVDLATGDQLQLTSGSRDSNPSFSASGNLLAFQRYESPSFTIYIAHADGSQARPLVRGSEPAFSPDDTKIVFVRAGGLYVTGLAPGSTVRRITDHPGDHAPQWSSTGQIVFQRTDIWRVVRHSHSVFGHPHLETREDLEVISPPNPRPRRILTYSQAASLSPDWSPDGTTVAVALCKEAVGRRVTARERALGQLTVPRLRFRSSCQAAVWAPAGGQLLEPGAPALEGRAQTSCPLSAGGRIAWQPIVAGTPRVPTVKCAPAKRGSWAAVLPVGIGPNEHVCIYSRRKHRRVCV